MSTINRKNHKSSMIAQQLIACENCPKKDLSLQVARTKESREANDQVCMGCPFFETIREISSSITDESKRALSLLDKGEDITTKELLFMLENGVHKGKIMKALKMKKDEFEPMVEQLTRITYQQEAEVC